MPIVDAIVHRLTRTDDERSDHLRQTALTPEEPGFQLLTEIRTLFNRRTRRYGRLHPESMEFRGLLQSYLDDTLGFTSFTAKVIEQLALKLDEQQQNCDGYWLFVIDEAEQEKRLWIAQLTQKEGLGLSRDAQLSPVEFIDLAKTGFCSCIQLSQMQEDADSNYFTLSFGFGDRALQPVLLDFFGFTDTVDTSADTERFMQLVTDYAKEMPEENARHYQKTVAEYCMEQDKVGEAVDYRELSREIESKAPEPFEAFVRTREPELKETFIPDKKTLKRFIRYTGRNSEVSISFSNDALGHNVRFDAASNELILTDLPAGLLKQLKGE